MMFPRKREVPPPLVRELAVDGIPVTVTCRVLTFTRAPYYRWLARPVAEAELAWAYRANALFDAHRSMRTVTTRSLGTGTSTTKPPRPERR